jgi:hypothetical protein
MKTKQRFQPPSESPDAARRSLSVKTLSLQVAITEPDLPQAVWQAFNLAKGGGRELNLAFSLQPGR